MDKPKFIIRSFLLVRTFLFVQNNLRLFWIWNICFQQVRGRKFCFSTLPSFLVRGASISCFAFIYLGYSVWEIQCFFYWSSFLAKSELVSVQFSDIFSFPTSGFRTTTVCGNILCKLHCQLCCLTVVIRCDKQLRYPRYPVSNLGVDKIFSDRVSISFEFKICRVLTLEPHFLIYVYLK